jgi:hypothetical protein
VQKFPQNSKRQFLKDVPTDHPGLSSAKQFTDVELKMYMDAIPQWAK